MKVFVSLICVVISLFVFSGCLDNIGETVESGKSVEFTFDKNNPSQKMKVDYDVTEVKLNSVKGKTIYYAEVNNTSEPISMDERRLIVNGETKRTAGEEYDDYEIRKTEKYFYCESDQYNFILYGKAKDENGNVCLVWIAKDCIPTSETSRIISPDSDPSYQTPYTKVTPALAQDTAEKFLKVYEEETKITGEAIARGDLFTNNNFNILLYDIDGDGSKAGTGGFFNSRDFKNYSNSNRGFFLYMDTYWCNSGDDAFKDMSMRESLSSLGCTTLIHELQHLILYSRKTYEKSVQIPSWYTEMLSMTMEDVFKESFDIAEESSVQKIRIPDFNNYYFLTAFNFDRTGTIGSHDYSSFYMLGAFLARNYGGKELMALIEKNALTGFDSISSAVKEATGKVITKEDLLYDFIGACIYRRSYAKKHNLPSFPESDGFEELNLWSSEYSFTIPTEENRYIEFSGPLAFRASETLKNNGTAYSIPKDGFIINYWDKAETDSVILNFSEKGKQGETVYIYIQDE